ncbi:putative transporter YisQ [Paenibacillus silvae]|uniref:Transporter YisQ n=1 Tax=Paenibacillus silvae TaxID=1325358 RepID=A0ABQ1ZDY2_9BACL|nr:MATE family efflux transporter [Paenibacillus silvae]GGH60745.1 putative transporter YisQ [Paenibacillus silvae]
MQPKQLNLFRLTWPIFMDAFFHIVLGNVDTVMLSHYSGQAVAAVGISSQIFGMFIIILEFMAMGSGILIAQMLGASQRERAANIAQSSIYLNGLIGVVLIFILFFSAPFLFNLFNLSAEAYEFGVRYSQIVSVSLLFEAILICISTTMRNYGFAKEPMFVVVGMNVVNVTGNSIALFGFLGFPETGLTGVAISSCISRLLAMICIVYLYKRKLRLKLRLQGRHYIQDWKSIVKVGIPTAGESFSYQSSQILITYFVTFFGVIAITTKVITYNIMLLIMIFSYSMGQATQILIGHLVGAREHQKAHDQAIFSLKVSSLISLLIALVCYFLSETVLGLFTSDRDIIETGKTLLALSILLEPGRAFNLVLSSSLKASGDIRFPTLLGLISMWGLCVPAAFILGNVLGYGLAGVWLAFILDEWLRGLIFYFRWKRMGWVTKGLVKAEIRSSNEKEMSI